MFQLMVSEPASSLGWLESCGFVMSSLFKSSSLVEFVCETGSIKNRKCLCRIMRVHTHDYRRCSFPFLILKVWRKENRVIVWILSFIPFDVCSGRGIQIQGQTWPI